VHTVDQVVQAGLDVRPAMPSSPADARFRRRSGVWLVVWTLVVVVAFVIGVLAHPGYPAGDWLPPFHATRRALTTGVLPALVVGVVGACLLPRAFDRLAWRPLLAATFAGATGWAVLLAISDGWGRLVTPIATRHDYLAAVPGVGSDPIGWLDRFTELIPTLPTHPSAHPPLPVLLMWGLDRIGIGGAGWAAASCIGVGASSVVAVLITVRVLGGEELARRAAPFLVLAPFALTVATCFDALFAGITAWAVAALAIAFERRSTVIGLAAGVLLASVLYLNYGLVVAGALAVAVAMLRWVPRVALAAVAGGVGVIMAFTMAGFWWFDGVAATHAEWSASLGGNRPYGYTVLGNLAVFAVLVGPATAAAAGWVRQRVLVALGGAALIAVLALDVAGVTRGEVERIWLPLAPWAVVMTAALPDRWVRPALLAQVLVAVAVQLMLRLSW
jgi:hypothetical protein